MIQQINHLNLEQEIGLMPIVTLNSDACIHVKRTMTVPSTAGAGEAVNNTNKKWSLNIVLPLPITYAKQIIHK